LYSINVKTAKPVHPKTFVEPHIPRDGQNLRNLPLKSCHRLIIQGEKIPQIKQQLKVKFEDGREALWKRGTYKI